MKTVSLGVVAMLAQEAARRGCDLYADLRAQAVPAQALEEIEGRIPLAAVDHVLEPVAADDPTEFALSMVRNGAMDGRAYFHYLTANAANVGDYLELTLRFSRLLADGTVLRARYDAHGVTVDHVLLEPATRPEVARVVARVGWMAGFVWRARAFSAGGFQPDAVCIATPAPQRREPLAQLFGVEPVFGAKETCVRFPNEALALAFPHSDATLRNVLELRAQSMLDALPPIADLRGNVKSTVRACLRAGDASLGAVAKALGMAPRTLQERLQAAGISFRRVVDESRMELAREYLERSELRVADVAYSLGFESPSAFARWYRRATGRSPAAQRRV
jgi:AraC-like DNA-binding protein